MMQHPQIGCSVTNCYGPETSAAFDWDYFERNPTVPNSRRRFNSYRLPNALINSIASLSRSASAFYVRNKGGKVIAEVPMRPGFPTLAVSLILTIAAGCAAPGTLAIQQAANQPPIQTTVPSDGSYGLFIAGQSEAIFTLDLKEGDKLGFTVTDGGTVGAMQIKWRCAVAGQRYLHLDFNTNYEWRRL
jgi:hypothetical protein